MRKSSLLFLVVACLRTAMANNLMVPAGGDLQAALNAAQAGDTVTLAAGATYVGHFYLLPNPGSQWITIQSSAMSSLPAGNRVSLALVSAMPKLVTPDGNPALFIGTGANYYRLQGIEFAPAAGVYAQDLIRIGSGAETSNSQLPHDLDFDRDYIHGDPSAGSKRGVALNGGKTSIENSYFSAFTSTGQDTQAICGWNGPGPYTITNNYLEAGSEIVAFGGAYVSNRLNVPSDILIKNNTFFKPLSWRPGDPSYAGTPVWAKNHIELKSAQRVTIDSNTFTNNWIGADQLGFAMVFGVRTEGGNVPWAVVNDVTFTNNIVRHSAGGALFMGHDGPGSGGSASRFLIQNNVWEDINGSYGGDGRLFQIQNNVNGINFDHNTAFETGWLAVFDSGFSFNVNFTNNIFTLGWGIVGTGAGVGTPALSAYSIGGTFADNMIIGNSLYPYPANTFFAPSLDQVGFVNFGGENFLLASNSPYKGMATDGSDIGSSLSTNTSQSPAVPTGWVNIVSKNSGKCMDVDGVSTAPGANIHQWTCVNGENQKFLFTPVAGGYKVTVKHSGLQLDIAGGPGATQNGAQLTQFPYWGGTNEIFQVNDVGGGYYSITVVNSGKCLDVSNVSKSDGALIHQWDYVNGDNQKWTFVPAQ